MVQNVVKYFLSHRHHDIPNKVLFYLLRQVGI